jgi:hypothetical protein
LAPGAHHPGRRSDACQKFGESESLRGGLGQFKAKHLMTLALANAGRLAKHGASKRQADSSCWDKIAFYY